MHLGIYSSAAYISDGPHSDVRLFLVERHTKPVDEDVALCVEGAGAVGYGISVGKRQKWCSDKLGENFVHDDVHDGVNSNLTPFLNREVIGPRRSDNSHRSLR